MIDCCRNYDWAPSDPGIDSSCVYKTLAKLVMNRTGDNNSDSDVSDSDSDSLSTNTIIIV